MAEALLELGRVDEAGELLRSTLRTSERLELRVLQIRCNYLLGLTSQSSGDEDAAGRSFSRAARLLDEVRAEAGEDDPLQRQDLQRIYEAVSG